MNDPDIDQVIDACCDRYEAAWRGGNSPELAEYLNQIDVAYRRHLLRELLFLELELAGPEHFAANAVRYREQFPEFDDVIDQCLSDQDAGDSQSVSQRRRSSESFSERPTNTPEDAAAEAAQAFSRNSPSTRMGNYKLLQVIGEGGMGSVWMAEQEKPVRRRVALKIIKAGLDSRDVIARFEAERQALAMMDHPNIARILDAGTTEQGQPYFAMELVKGVPLTEYCDAHRLDLPQRLKLFMQVCDAVGHAHHKGIIHRDLKPSNILVAEYNGQPVPKVIDFGLAKALEATQRLTDKSLFTEFGQVLGTLKYMSPEQAGLDSLDIDTRSDIYALGVILYELLTGSTPLESDSFKGQALLKVLELIRDQESPRPSSRLATTKKETLTAVTEKRRTDAKRLGSVLLGDLDWIVMMALDKDRNRRYESANGFRQDIERYLGNEPVTARPPSFGYRCEKLIRKHKSLVFSTMAFVGLLIIGTIVSLGFAWTAKVAAEEAVRQKDIAEQNFENAWDAIDSLSQLADDPRLKERGVEPLRRDILTKARGFYSDLVSRSPDTSLPWQDQKRYVQSLVQLGSLDNNLGERTLAMDSLRRAQEFLAKAGSTHDEALRLRVIAARELAIVYSQLRQFPEAKAAMNVTREHTNQLKKIKGLELEAAYETAMNDICQGNIEYNSRKFADSEESLNRAAIALEQLRFDENFADENDQVCANLGDALRSLCSVRRLTHTNSECIEYGEEALAVFRTLLESNRNELKTQLSYIVVLDDVSELYINEHQHEPAIAHLTKAAEVATQLVERYPSLISCRYQAAKIYDSLGHSFLARHYQGGKYLDQAEVHLNLAMTTLAKLPEDSIQWPEVTDRRHRCWVNIGSLKYFQNDFEDAIEYFSKANRGLDAILARDPSNIEATIIKVSCLSGLGRALASAGKFDAAKEQAQLLIRLGKGHFGQELIFSGAVVMGLAAITAEEESASGNDHVKSQLKEEFFNGCLEALTELANSDYRFEEGFELERLRDFEAFRSFIEKYRYQLIE